MKFNILKFLGIISASIIFFNTFVSANDNKKNLFDNTTPINRTEITAPENTTKNKDELLDTSYYSSDSNWSKTFERLDEYIGNNEPEEVFGVTNYNINNDEEFNFDDELALIFYKDLLNQEYVVDLINDNSENKTTIDNWKFNLQFLEDNYELICENPNIDTNIIDIYIEDYRGLLLTEDLPDYKPLSEPIESIEPYSTTSYKNKVVAYIDKYWNNPNKSYPYWPDYNSTSYDCANFVSQCLYAGGKAMKGTPGTSSAANNLNNWFSKGSAFSTVNVSSTWRGANAFKSYWLNNCVGYRFYNSNTTGPYDYSTYGDVGDAVSITNANKVGKHTMIVYKKELSNLILAAHSNNTKSASFGSKFGSWGGGAYILKM